MLVPSRISLFGILCSLLSSEKRPATLEDVVDVLDEDHWRRLIRLADESYVLPALYPALLFHDVLERVDVEVKEYLALVHELTAERNRLILLQTVAVVRLLNGFGIEPLPLKGCASLLMGEYGAKGERILTDIDILVSEADIDKAIAVLQDSGYRYYKTPNRSDLDLSYRHHALPLVADGEPVSVELHIRPTPLRERGTLLDAEMAWSAAMRTNRHGCTFWIPSLEFRMLHAFYHSQIGDKWAWIQSAPLRSLMDFQRLASNGGERVDWEAMWGLVQKYRLERPYSLYVDTCRKYFGLTVPDYAFKKGLLLKYDTLWRDGIQRYPLVAKIRYLYAYALKSLYRQFSLLQARKDYGDLPVIRLIYYRMCKGLSFSLYARKVRDMGSIFRSL